MQKYIVVNRHAPEECEPMEAGLRHVPPQLNGADFYCTCPEGPHAFYLIVRGETAESVIGGLPQEWRRGSEAYPVEVFPLSAT